jgi:lysine 2,3-aminomutase
MRGIRVSKDFTPDCNLLESKASEPSWKEQLKCSFKTREQFEGLFKLTDDEIKGFEMGSEVFNIQTTPYYAGLADPKNLNDPIRKMIMPSGLELQGLELSQKDPLAEVKNSPCERIVHRYADRVLFLITDFCGIYCRYCTRKHFTGGGKVFPQKDTYLEALEYIKNNKGIREVILSGGDPLTLSNSKLKQVIDDLDAISHVELIRVGSRMPAACPMRLDPELLQVFKAQTPVILMTHFNHHQELPAYTKSKLRAFAEGGVQILNQTVLLNGINNSAALIYKLSRELISCKVFPYYMFQCDPSPGTGHLQTSIDDSLKIQKELWGRSSGIALPTYSIDIPSGGGKTYLTPNFIEAATSESYKFRGFDGVSAEYFNPDKAQFKEPFIDSEAHSEWEEVVRPSF